MSYALETPDWNVSEGEASGQRVQATVSALLQSQAALQRGCQTRHTSSRCVHALRCRCNLLLTWRCGQRQSAGRSPWHRLE